MRLLVASTTARPGINAASIVRTAVTRAGICAICVTRVARARICTICGICVTRTRIIGVEASGNDTISVDGGLGTVLSNDDDDGAVSGKGVEDNLLRPGAGEIDILIATLGSNLDAGGVISGIVCDGSLNIGDGDILASDVGFGKGLKGKSKGLGIEPYSRKT